MSTHTPIVQALIRLVNGDAKLAQELESAIHEADLSIKTLEDFYVYLDRLSTLVPSNRSSLAAFGEEFYYIIDQSQGGYLKSSEPFKAWSDSFVDTWAHFLDSPESTSGIGSFYGNKKYRLGDYQTGPSGWMSFNQFFAREVKPGKRPVDGLCDDRVVVSPADSLFMDQDEIQLNSTIITAKHGTCSIGELLEGSPFADCFAGGTFTHSLLNTWDYHRFHVPVGGTVVEKRKIPGEIGLDIKKVNGKLVPQVGTGFQFKQDRGLMVLDSPIGYVAILPIGMAEISSITFTPDEGAELVKGEECGYFQFGGSDIVTLYQKGRVELTADPGKPYDQGMAIGTGTLTGS